MGSIKIEKTSPDSEIVAARELRIGDSITYSSRQVLQWHPSEPHRPLQGEILDIVKERMLIAIKTPSGWLAGCNPLKRFERLARTELDDKASRPRLHFKESNKATLNGKSYSID